MPLAMSMTSVFLALSANQGSRTLIRNPTLLQIQSADSVHVLGFTSQGDLLIAESEGSFSMDDWDEVYEAGRAICCDNIPTDEDIIQDDELKAGGMRRFVKSTLQAKVQADLYWKG